MADVNREIKKLDLELGQVTRTTSLFNQNQIQKLWNSTSPKFKYQRPAKGGGSWTYVKASYVRKVLDSVFGFDWSFEIETSLSEAFEVASKTGTCVVKGTLTCRVNDGGGRLRDLKKTQFGRSDVKWQMESVYNDMGQEVKKYGKTVKQRKVDPFTKSPMPLDFGNDMKAATSDCLKKCASLFGVASDIYEAEEFTEINIIDSQEDKAKGAERLIKKNKKLAEKESEAVND